jgi:hypothetical protein
VEMTTRSKHEDNHHHRHCHHGAGLVAGVFGGSMNGWSALGFATAVFVVIAAGPLLKVSRKSSW